MIAAVQIRGMLGANQQVKDTLKMLNLGRVNSCVLLEDTPVNKGMLLKVKDFVAFGEVSDEVADSIRKLIKGKTAHLHPPRGGIKSVKRAFTAGGDLGHRPSMDELVRRMLP